VTKFSSKYDPGVEAPDTDVLCLHRNENHFVGPDWTVDTARALVESAAIASYPDATSRPLREALAELYGVESENVFIGNGSDEVLADLLSLLRLSFDTVSCLDVCFQVYPMLLERLGFASEVLPGETFKTGRVEASGFKGLALVDSPNGITGRAVDPEQLLGLADDPESFLIWDNAYGEYARHEMPAPRPNLAFVRSFSKFYALAGLRVGYCIADASLVSELLARKDAFNVGGFSQAMALEALRRRDEFEALRDRLVEQRTALTSALSGLGFEVMASDFVAVLASHPAHDAEHLRTELMKRKVAVRRFAHPAVENFIRITVAPEPQMGRLLDALGQIVGT
jgi:histidinol-phosphate aminotransferase